MSSYMKIHQLQKVDLTFISIISSLLSLNKPLCLSLYFLNSCVETVCEPTKVEEFNETAGTEEKLVMNESLEETTPAGNVVRLDQEIYMEQRTGFPEIEPQEILNLDNRVLDGEVINEGKADKEISKPGSQGSNGFEDYKEERDMEIAREASLKRMSRCRSLPVSHNSRVTGDSPVQGLVSEVAYPSRNKTGFDKAKKSGILPVSCQTSNKVQETTEAKNESSKEAKLEMRSPIFSNDLRIEEKSDEPTEETPLLSQDKTETYKATFDVEEETVMLKRSETEQIRGFELSLGLSMNLSGRCGADDSFKETESSEDNLLEEKPNMSETLL
ncbi:BnaA08g29470D, partial [Brassica napus]